MQKLTLLFACLACAGHGRRVQTQQPGKAKDLAKLLLTHSQAPAFSSSVAGQYAPETSALRSASPSMATSKIKNPSKALPFLEAPYCQISGLAGAEAGFDPLYLSDYFDIKWLREAELKHGRICMLATTGIIFQEFYSLPKYPGYTPNPVEALSTVPQNALLQILAFAAYVEITSNKGKIDQFTMFEDPNRKPGDVGFDPLKFGENPKTRERLELAELKNGRLAMLAFFGMITQVQVTGKPVIASLGDIFANPN
mmetsp:Transcript_79394/g.146008  ORF Transcript_79394/g.146008 Transcript_79394/m.146008 type:complete len:254 (-) Transcript_79394:77-838(-)